MPLWRFVPVADTHDSRWQDRRIWHGLVVRAPSAAMARVVAEKAEERQVRGSVGNETGSLRGGFADASLYWVQRLSPEEAKQHGGEQGPMGVVAPGEPEEPALSVFYGLAGARRRGGEASQAS